MFIDSKISTADFQKKRQELEDIMVGQLRELDAEFNLYYVEQDLNASDFKNAKRQGKAPKLEKRYK